MKNNIEFINKKDIYTLNRHGRYQLEGSRITYYSVESCQCDRSHKDMYVHVPEKDKNNKITKFELRPKTELCCGLLSKSGLINLTELAVGGWLGCGLLSKSGLINYTVRVC